MLGHARLDTVAPTPTPPSPTSPKLSPCCHKTADQHRWRHYTYLVATRGTPRLTRMTATSAARGRRSAAIAYGGDVLKSPAAQRCHLAAVLIIVLTAVGLRYRFR